MRIDGNRVRQAKMESQGLSFHYLNGYADVARRHNVLWSPWGCTMSQRPGYPQAGLREWGTEPVQMVGARGDVCPGTQPNHRLQATPNSLCSSLAPAIGRA